MVKLFGNINPCRLSNGKEFSSVPKSPWWLGVVVGEVEEKKKKNFILL
jgi:hypothetical protein